MGRVVTIFLRPSTRTPVQTTDSTRAVAGRGLEGDHSGGGKRQLTLLSREAWERACADLDAQLDPALRRANLVVEGVDLAATIGRQIEVGEALIEVVGETKPCQLMDDQHPGLWDALKPECRGGVYGKILRGGEVAVGATVQATTTPA